MKPYFPHIGDYRPQYGVECTIFTAPVYTVFLRADGIARSDTENRNTAEIVLRNAIGSLFALFSEPASKCRSDQLGRRAKNLPCGFAGLMCSIGCSRKTEGVDNEMV